MSTQTTVVCFNPLLSIVATSDMGIDAFGFIILDKKPVGYLKFPNKALYAKISRGIGRGNYKCKDLCRLIPKKNQRNVSYSETGEYFCMTCEIAMKCPRCHCCGRPGRVEPRGRHKRLDRKGVKFIE